MFRRAALLALALLAPLPALAAAQQTYPPEGLDDFTDSGVSATSLDLCWASENADQVDSWTLTMARGTTPPPEGTAGTEIPGGNVSTCHRVDGLAPGETYTFALVGHNAAGDGPRQIHTAATRIPGAFVRDHGGTHRLPRSGEYSQQALAVARSTGRIHAVFLGTSASGHHLWLYHSSRAPGGRWSTPTLVTSHMVEYGASIATDDRGAVVVGWSSDFNGPEYRLLRAGAKRWDPVRKLPSPKPFHERLDSVALDRAGHVHASLTRFGDWPGIGVHVRTLAGGHWRDALVPGSTCSGGFVFECRSRLAIDPSTDRVTLALRHTAHGTGSILVADAPARAKRLGRPHRVASAPVGTLRLLPASLDARAGRVMLALRGKAPIHADRAPGAGLYLATGTSAAHMGRARRIAGSGARDTWAAAVAVTGARSALLAWQRDCLLDWRDDSSVDPSWNPAQQGIWMRPVTVDRRTGRARVGKPTHVDDSAYAGLFGLAADRRGRPVVGFLR